MTAMAAQAGTGAAQDDLVRVWLIRADLPTRLLAELETVLDEAERRRAASLAMADHRRRFIAAHGAVRMILGGQLGVEPGRFRWRLGPNGKPELAGRWRHVQVNLSHSASLAALAVSWRRPVGVDVQHFPPGIDAARMAQRYFPEAEARFVAAGTGREQVARFARLWARKEACVKAAGGHLMQGMGLPVRGSGGVLVRDPSGGLPGAYLVHDVLAPPGFRAAVAVAGPAPYQVARYWWPGSKPNRAGEPAKPAECSANTQPGASANTLLDTGSTISQP
jgi:4'-phosphopantetheinyl transferase